MKPPPARARRAGAATAPNPLTRVITPPLPAPGIPCPAAGKTCRPDAGKPWHADCLSRPAAPWPRDVECTVADIPCPRMSGAWRALLALALLVCAIPAAAQVRIKDIADVEGVRDNQLVGYGLVVGLNGTGDRLRSAVFTRQSLIGVLERLGVNTRDQEQRLDTRNVAAVMVTANLPPFARPGSRIDIAVSTLGDATNITGGTLLVTPLLGADGEVYAVAQGSVATGAIAARGAAASVTRGVPTAGRIPNGAVVEREVAYQFARTPQIRLSLRNPDLTTARRMAEAINRHARGNVAQANDPRTVTVALAGRDPVAFLTEIEQLRVQPDQVARIVIEEASGTIVMGANVRVSTVAIAQGNLTIRITETPQVAQPNPLAGGQTVVVPRTGIEVDDQSERRMGILNGGVTLAELVRGLNSLGVGPRDLITILQTIKAAGALQAELEIR
jgi:flagellar P-ring protein precursor FlgI